MIRSVHPFPARMGPDLAIDRLKKIGKPSVVLDPMAGSGTVLRHASELGHTAIGRDLDPLAILMSKVWTTRVDRTAVEKQLEKLLSLAEQVDPKPYLPWIDDDQETKKFVDFWFAERQQNDLRRIAFAIQHLAQRKHDEHAERGLNVLRLAMSRIIITKDGGASLGRDISHSRPHKVEKKTEYEVFPGFRLSVRQILDRLMKDTPKGGVTVKLGDARYLSDIERGTIDVVLTSPPYLNAIDYMRGHRLSLVWFGYGVGDLRKVRAISVGSERGPEVGWRRHEFRPILDALGDVDQLPNSDVRMVERYAEDIYRLMGELARVLHSNGRVFLVVGDSCLRKVFVSNSEGFIAAGKMVGLRLTRRVERDLPIRKRYLPMPKGSANSLGKRMRTENVLTFMHS